jgi:hypothetical protein
LPADQPTRLSPSLSVLAQSLLNLKRFQEREYMSAYSEKVLGWSIIALLMLFGGTVKGDVIWPQESDWTAIRSGANYYYDAEGDQSPASIDLIGTTDIYSAGYWALVSDGYVSGGTTGDVFMIRLRVGGNGGNYVWQAHFETDGNSSDIEWIYQLVQSGNPADHGVALIQTAVGGSTLSEIDTGSNVSAWQGNLAEFSRWSTISGTTHYHVDFAVPWTEFSSFTGVTNITDMRVILSTSTSHSGINKDAPLGNSLSEQISEALSDSIPEPTVASLIIGAGCGLVFYRRMIKRSIDEEQP